MAQLTYFTVYGDFLSIIGDTLADPDPNPDTVGISGSVTFTPSVTQGDALLAVTLDPRPAMVIPAAITASIAADGQLKYDAGLGVRLVANTPVLGLVGNLYYTVSFSGLTVRGRSVRLNSFSFAAPTVDTFINLANVARAAGSVPQSTGHAISTVDDISDLGTFGKLVILSETADDARAALEYQQVGYAETIGTGIDTLFTITHNLGTTDVSVGVYRIATGEVIDADITHTGSDTVTVEFGEAPGVDAYRVTVETSRIGFLTEGVATGVVGEQLAAASTVRDARTVLSLTDIRPEDYGAVGNGVANDRSALVAASAAAVAAGRALLLTKTYRVGTSVTLAAPIVARRGARLVPSSGAAVVLSGGFVTDGLYQVFDHQYGGTCAPLNVDYFHPAWWGPTGTADDSQTWRDMLSVSYNWSGSGYQQRVLAPVGASRLWEVDVEYCAIIGAGNSSWIQAASTATPGDPTAGTGYILKLNHSSTLDGVDVDTGTTHGAITAVLYTGADSYISNCTIRCQSIGSVGVWTYAPLGNSIAPRLNNVRIKGYTDEDPRGIGIRAESHDGQVVNCSIEKCDTGIYFSRASWWIIGTHIWGNNNNVTGTGFFHRFIGGQIANANQWGVHFWWGAVGCYFDRGTRFYDNGHSVVDPTDGGAIYLDGVLHGSPVQDNRIDATFDDNYGTSIWLRDADRTTGSPVFTSTGLVSGDGPALAVTGVLIDSDCAGTELDIRTYPAAVTGTLVSNAAPDLNRVTFSSIPQTIVTAAGTTTLTAASSPVQVCTGATTQTVKLPTGITAGQEWVIINASAGTVDVQSSDGGALWSVPGGRVGRFIAEKGNPTTASDWSTFIAGSPTGTAAYATAFRDANANLAANNFVPAATSTATAAGTTTLDAASTRVQEFTGTTTQTVKLPTGASVKRGMNWSIVNSSTGALTVQSSDGSTLFTIPASRSGVFEVKADNPTTTSHWAITSLTPTASAYAASTLALRDSNSNLFAVNFITGRGTVATAAGTTTLGVGDYRTQVFTGTSTQTVKLPTTNVTAGMDYRIINQSTGDVTVQSSGANTIATLTGAADPSMKVFIALKDAPTTAAHWRAI